MTIKEVLEHPEKVSFDVDQLGECAVDSPITGGRFVEDGDRTLFVHDADAVAEAQEAQMLRISSMANSFFIYILLSGSAYITHKTGIIFPIRRKNKHPC